MRRPVLAYTAILASSLLLGALLPSPADAHFILQEPESWRDQNGLGDPQKLGPCGNDGNAAETGAITSYKPGETIDIKIRETIFHPGHYRIALSVDDRSELPDYPPVTAGSTACGSAPIDPNPSFPVLADGLLEHTKPFAKAKTMQVTLPDDVTCERCTLQVIQFMSNHALNDPGGCYYSHCADISISGTPVPADTSADEPSPGDSDLPDEGKDVASTGGCSSAAPLGGASMAWLAALGGVALVRRRRAAHADR